MSEGFNPYHEWLGVDRRIAAPNYYEMLGIEESEPDVEKIAIVADRALSRVRGFKPGNQAAQWAKLLDELTVVKRCLTTAFERATYDRTLHRTSSVSETSGSATTAADGLQDVRRHMYPPGCDPNASVTIPVSPMAPFNPMGPVSPMSPLSPMAPMGPVSPMTPMAPVSTMSSVAPMSAVSPGPMAAVVPMPNYGTPSYGSPMSPAPMASGIPVAQVVSPASMGTIPVAMGVPLASAVAPMAYPMPASPMLASAAPRAAQLVSSASAPASPVIHGGSSVTGELVARKQSTANMGLFLGVGGTLLVGIIGVVVLVMMNSFGESDRDKQRVAKNDVAHTPSGHSSTTNVSATQSQEPRTTRPRPRKNSPPVPVISKPVANDSMPDEDSAMMDDEDTPPAMPTPEPESKPAPMPSSEPTPPVPNDPPPPTPEVPTTKPIENPTPPKPMPVEPPAEEMPARQDVIALEKALKQARVALGELNLDEADQLLAKVEALPKLAAHQQKYERVKQLSMYVSQFRDALNESIGAMQAGSTITVGNTTVAFVEFKPSEDIVTLKVSGRNRSYPFKDLPVGLAVGIADQWFDKRPANKIIKGAFVLAHRNANDDMRSKARNWWQEAKSDFPQIIDTLLPLFEDTYELTKDLPAAPANN